MTIDSDSPNVYQTTQPAQGERPAASLPIRGNFATAIKLLDGTTIIDGHGHDYETLPIAEGRGVRSILADGHFEYDNGSGVNLFQSWTATGTSVVLAATSVAGEFELLTQAAELTNGASNAATLEQSVANADEPLTSLLGFLQGKTVVFVARVRTATAARVRIAIFDDDGGGGTQEAESGDHTGGDTFETLACALTIQSDATDIVFRLEIDTGGAISAFIDAARVFVVGVDAGAVGIPNVLPPSLAMDLPDFIPDAVAGMTNAPVNVNNLLGMDRTRSIILGPGSAELVDANVPNAATASVGWPRLLTYDDTTEEFARYTFCLPVGYTGSMVVKAKFKGGATTGNFGVIVQVMATSDGDVANADSFDSDNAATQAMPGTTQQQETIEIPLTNDDGAAALDTIVLLFSRDTTSGDTVTGDIDVGTIVVEFQGS